MDRREHHRAQLRLPVRIRWNTPFGQKTEVCKTLDISRGGLLAPCQETHAPGVPLWVTFPYDSSMGDGQPEMAAKVVRVTPVINGNAAHESRNFFLEGPAGRLEAILWRPVAQQRPQLAALVCHPHPLFGGTMHNKVVYQAAKTLGALGLPVLRFNFRGAGLSEGVHDRGRGEQGDVKAAVDFLVSGFPGVPLLLAGFSFGSWV